MIIPFDTLLLLLLVPAALWYLGSRATITRPLWARYPTWLTSLTDCAACSGFWWGVIGYIIAWHAKTIPHEGPYTVYTAPFFGLVTLITTPLIAFLHDQALYRLGTVVPEKPPKSEFFEYVDHVAQQLKEREAATKHAGDAAPE